MSFKKIVRFILVIIILILLFTIIRSTYSKYVTAIDKNTGVVTVTVIEDFSSVELDEDTQGE